MTLIFDNISKARVNSLTNTVSVRVRTMHPTVPLSLFGGGWV